MKKFRNLVVTMFTLLAGVLFVNGVVLAQANFGVLAQGSQAAFGATFNTEDRLCIASLYGRKILIMDPDTGQILETYDTVTGVETPADVAYGPDGSLYWTAALIAEVGRRSTGGNKTGQTVADGVAAVAFSDGGRLFVSTTLVSDALYEVDPNLVNAPRLIAQNLGQLADLDWGPDGLLYGACMLTGQVIRIDVDSAAVTTVAQGFTFPTSVQFDSQGRLHVTDGAAGELSRVDTATGAKEVIATGLIAPGSIAFDSQDRLFLVNSYDGSALEVLSNGTTRTVTAGGMIAPGGVAVLPGPGNSDSVFVADVFTLREFDGLTGQQLSGEMHLGFPGITTPATVSADGNNLVLTGLVYGFNVQVWNPDTQQVSVHIDYPTHIVPVNAIRFQGDLIVAELNTLTLSGRVMQVDVTDPSNPVSRRIPTSFLAVPMGLAATEDDLWVADWYFGSVMQIVADGVPLNPANVLTTSLVYPEGLALDTDGTLLVVETGTKKLLRIDPETRQITTVAQDLPLVQQGPPDFDFWMFNGVAVGPTSGAIYVTGDSTNVLLRSPPPPIPSPAPQFTGLSADITDTPQPEDAITFIATTTGTSYKFWYRAGYGTAAYSTNQWVEMQDYSTANECIYTFPAADNYIVVVNAAEDVNNIPDPLPMIGMNIRVENQ